jgi:hypothetical protein
MIGGLLIFLWGESYLVCENEGVCVYSVDCVCVFVGGLVVFFCKGYLFVIGDYVL